MALAFCGGGLGKTNSAFAEDPRPVDRAPAPASSASAPPSAPASSARPEGASPSPSGSVSPSDVVLPSTGSAASASPAISTPTPSASPGAATGPSADAPILHPADAVEGTPGEGGKGKKKKGGKGDKAKDDDKDKATPIGKNGRFGAFQLKGRVYARAEYDRSKSMALNDALVLTEKTVDSLDLSVPSARLSFHYHAPAPWLTAVVEIDISGKPDMKDGYIQAKDDHFAARAGQFKMPVSSMETTSPWALPLVRRGLLHDVLTDRLDSGGRRPGFTVGWHDRDLPLSPRVTLGAFQGSVLQDTPTALERDTDLLNAQKFPSQSLVARAEIEVVGTEFGAYYEDRIGSPEVFQTYRYWTAGIDAHYDHVFENGGLRFWLDGIAGASWYKLDSKPKDGKDATFVMARALVAYRFGGTTDEAFYVEPYALGGALDPDADIKSDLIYEGVLGVNVGLWNRARLSLQGEVNKGQKNFPTGYYGGPPPDRLGLILQAGVAF